MTYSWRRRAASRWARAKAISTSGLTRMVILGLRGKPKGHLMLLGEILNWATFVSATSFVYTPATP